MIKGLVFDLGGVVFISDGWSYETREKIAEELLLDAKKFQDFWFARKVPMITGKLSEDNFLSELISSQQINLDIMQFKRKIRELNILDKDMINILNALKQRYRLFALTNDVKEWIEHRIKTFSLLNYFDFIVSSSDVGCSKPDKEIYDLLIKKTNMPAKDLIFIDNREENLQPAEELGMKTYHFKRADEFAKWLKEQSIL